MREKDIVEKRKVLRKKCWFKKHLKKEQETVKLLRTV